MLAPEHNAIIRCFKADHLHARDHRDLEEAVRWLLPRLDEEEHHIVMTLICEVCPHCRETFGTCNCWNDD